MKRKCRIIVSVALMLCMLVGLAVPARVTMAYSTKIIKVKGFQITDKTRLSQIEKKFGKAKLVTDSMYGGKAYSFYGTDYSDYVFLESDENGHWVGGGAIGCSFQTSSYKWDTLVDNYVHDGTALYDFDDGYAYGACEYYVSDSEHNKAKKRYNSSISIRIGFSKHALMALNAVNHYIGDEQRFSVTDDQLAIVDQIYEKSGMTIDDYMSEIGKSAYYNMFSLSRFNKLKAFMCPFSVTEEAINYRAGDVFSVPVLSFRKIGDDLYREAGFLNPKFMEEWKVIPYTDTEKKLLENAKSMYEQSIAYWNKEGSYYITEPSVLSLPIEPGKISEDKLKGATYFINMVRAGADLPPFEYDVELCQKAQNKAALVVYCSSNNLPSGHYFEKPDGVSDELYQSAMESSGENLYMCGIISGTIIGSICHALDDTYGDPVSFGHRYQLLSPSPLHFGIGQAELQGCHKFMVGDVTQPYTPLMDKDIIAWPSKGVTLLEATGNSTVWSIKFYNGYTVTNSTKVIVSLLNTDESWTYDKDSNNSSTHCNFLSNQINIQSAALQLSKGNVYRVDIENLKDSNGNNVSYSYRSVIESMAGDKSAVPLTGISISKSVKSMVVGETYYADYQVVPNNCMQVNAGWSSSDPSVVSVNDCGIMTAKGTGTAVITVRSKYKDQSASFTVTVKKAPPKVKIKSIKAGKSKTNVKWGKCSNVSGYEVRYSKYKTMENAKVITVKGAGKTKADIKKLKKGTYYVSVQSYYLSNKTKVYGKSSKVKKVKI